MAARQEVIAVEPEIVLSGKLPQNNVSARRPSAVAQKIPISAPNLELDAGGGDGMKELLAAGGPPPEKSKRASPPWIVGWQRTVDLIAVSERHIDQRFTERRVVLTLV